MQSSSSDTNQLLPSNARRVLVRSQLTSHHYRSTQNARGILGRVKCPVSRLSTSSASTACPAEPSKLDQVLKTIKTTSGFDPAELKIALFVEAFRQAREPGSQLVSSEPRALVDLASAAVDLFPEECEYGWLAATQTALQHLKDNDEDDEYNSKVLGSIRTVFSKLRVTFDQDNAFRTTFNNRDLRKTWAGLKDLENSMEYHKHQLIEERNAERTADNDNTLGAETMKFGRDAALYLARANAEPLWPDRLAPDNLVSGTGFHKKF